MYCGGSITIMWSLSVFISDIPSLRLYLVGE